MVVVNIVREGKYYDSVLLMRVSQTASQLEGVEEVAIVMATDLNKMVLRNIGLWEDKLKDLTPNDLVISMNVEEGEKEGILKLIEEELAGHRRRREKEYHPKSLESALEAMPDATLAAISVPGEHAYKVASEALDRGLHLFIFSSNVPLDRELELKKRGREKGLLIMGPDCGTMILNGVIMGFGNVISHGPIGIVGAAGTGIQQVTSILQRMDVGITHAIGTGGNDLSKDIGGITTMEGLKLLQEDAETKLIILISKPPDERVEEDILQYMRGNVTKPVVANFVGGDLEKVEKAGFASAWTLDGAAVKAVSMLKGKEYANQRYTFSLDNLAGLAEKEWRRLADDQKYIRGLYSGGTLCYEAQVILKNLIGDAYSNSPLNSNYKLDDSNKSKEHTLIDLGGEEFVVGRPHPIIDPTLRRYRILQEGNDPSTAAVILDIVIGYGAHEDPAGALIPDIEKAKKAAEGRGGYLPVVATVIGTEMDPQGLSIQEKKLMGAGVVTLPSNSQACMVAGLISTRGEGLEKFRELFRVR